jgi:hypothetical protein
MTNCLHCMTFAEEVSQTDVSVLNLKLLYYYWYFSPFGLINNSIPSFTDLTFDH